MSIQYDDDEVALVNIALALVAIANTLECLVDDRASAKATRSDGHVVEPELVLEDSVSAGGTCDSCIYTAKDVKDHDLVICTMYSRKHIVRQKKGGYCHRRRGR